MYRNEHQKRYCIEINIEKGDVKERNIKKVNIKKVNLQKCTLKKGCHDFCATDISANKTVNKSVNKINIKNVM